MTRFAIDAPTLLHLVGAELEVHPDHQLVAPNLIRSQALALLFAAVSNGELTERAALDHHVRLTEMKMRLLGDRVSRRTAWSIAKERGWAATYDAEYFAVCPLQADAFVSVDDDMRAKAQGIVPLAQLNDLLTG